MSNVCLCNSDGLVVNKIVLDGGQYIPPSGLVVVESQEAQIGDSIINGEVIKKQEN